MENCKLSTIESYNKLIKAFPEFKEFTNKEIIEVKKYLNKNSIVLDIGCGFGREIKELAPFCKKIIGIDIDSEEIKTAKKYLKDIQNKELLIEDAKKIHFPDEYFDIIILLGNTFGNFDKDKIQILKEVRRLSKKEGKIFIGVNKKSAIPKKVEAFKKIGLKVKEIRDGKIIIDTGLISECFTKDKLKDIFKKADLKVKFIDINPIAYMCVLSKC